MKEFKRVGAQGEITIRRIGDLPKRGHLKLPQGYTAVHPNDGKFIIGHSETGHHHVIDADGAVVGVMDKPPAGMRVLYMILNNPLAVTHLRAHDTHETITADTGIYEARIAREFDHYAELARQSAD
jgi:hypothetical protein